MKSSKIILLTILAEILFFGKAGCGEMVEIKGGEYIPLYGRDSVMVKVEDFKMDVYPVTVGEYEKFLKKYPKYRPSKISKLFTDQSYLHDWINGMEAPKSLPKRSPVTNISWFAALAYCECQGKTLPTIDQWEYAAMASKKKKDGRTDSTYNAYILSWYEAPHTNKNKVGSTFKNYWGVWDLHGLVWEWTLDFNSVLISGESRNDGDIDRTLFCGSAALGANDLMNYAAFMRYAFRGSMKAKYSIKNLGFRCSKNISK